MKKVLSILLIITLLGSLAVGCSNNNQNNNNENNNNSNEVTNNEASENTNNEDSNSSQEENEDNSNHGEADKEEVEIEVVASQPEYMAQEKEIWSLYEQENENVTVKVISINEDTQAAFNTRVAAGNPPDIQSYAGVDKTNYDTYVNLLEIDYPYLDNFQYDAKKAWSEANGVENYLPVLGVFAGPTFSFIYYEDEMDNAGLNPRESIRSMEDLDNFLADLKEYTDQNDSIEYVLDTGWHSWCWGSMTFSMIATALGSNQEIEKDLWITGEMKWTDMENNPYVPVFEKLKEYYDKGYMPTEWWTRNWENDFEAGFAARKSILAFHGPWLWTKVESADPTAQLSGFPLPPNDDGIIQNAGADIGKGAALFTANADKDNYDETLDAFIWFNSPEIIKLRAEAFGQVPAFDLSEVGSAELASPQYNEVIKPINEGFFGENVIFDSSTWASTLSAKYLKKNKPQIIADDANAVNIGNYLTGKISIEELMEIFQQRFDDGMELPQ